MGDVLYSIPAAGGRPRRDARFRTVVALGRRTRTLVRFESRSSRFRFRAAVDTQHRLAEGVQLVRRKRAEDLAVGLIGGAKARPELPQPGRCQAYAAAAP